jgi:dihydrofolate reductase
MRKIILIVHTSLDGFVAGEKGEFDSFNPGPDNLDFVCSLTDGADAALAGRISYEMLDSYWPTAGDKKDATASEKKYSDWYNASEKIVLSETLSENKPGNVTVVGDDIKEKIIRIKNKKGKNILMFGSPTAFQSLNKLDLIDEYWVINYPVIFGKGIPFFTLAQMPRKLKTLNTRQLSNGEIATHYKVV